MTTYTGTSRIIVSDTHQSSTTRSDMIIDAHCYMLMRMVYLKTLALLLLLLLCELFLLAPPSVLAEGMRMRCASCTSTIASER